MGPGGSHGKVLEREMSTEDVEKERSRTRARGVGAETKEDFLFNISKQPGIQNT